MLYTKIEVTNIKFATGKVCTYTLAHTDTQYNTGCACVPKVKEGNKVFADLPSPTPFIDFSYLLHAHCALA